MDTSTLKRVFLSLAILVIVALPFAVQDMFQTSSVGDMQSVELGIASFSPSGVAGGAVIPASCGSPHSGDLCTPPSVSDTCDSILNEGESCDITFSCVDSSSSSGVNFSTGGATSGSVSVTPDQTTTFTVLCSNGGQASVTVTVLNPDLTISATPTLLQSGDTSTITWSATGVNSCSISEDNGDITDSWSGTSGTQTTSPINQETMYTLNCTTDAGSVSQSVTVRLIPIFQEF